MGPKKLAMVKTSGLSVLNLAMTGLMLMTFMTVHLFQFRFGDTDQFGPYYIQPPQFMIKLARAFKTVRSLTNVEGLRIIATTMAYSIGPVFLVPGRPCCISDHGINLHVPFPALLCCGQFEQLGGARMGQFYV